MSIPRILNDCWHFKLAPLGYKEPKEYKEILEVSYLLNLYFKKNKIDKYNHRHIKNWYEKPCCKDYL